MLFTAPVYLDTASNVLGVLAAADDVTYAKRQPREFSETKAFLDNILQSATKYSIIGMDLDHRILSWNEGARRNYGYAAEEILGRDTSILHTPEDLESGAVDRLLATAREDGLAEGEFERVRKDGSRFTASVVVTRRDDFMGYPIGFLLMSNDITAQKRAERELAKQRARELDRLAELERFQKLTVGRELRMIELKKEIEDLRAAAGGNDGWTLSSRRKWTRMMN